MEMFGYTHLVRWKLPCGVSPPSYWYLVLGHVVYGGDRYMCTTYVGGVSAAPPFHAPP